jgi:flagellar secretion chaperone FliS
MTAYSRSSNLAAYQSASVHGGVAAADPHRLVLMLMDGALERIVAARGVIENGMPEARGRLLHRAVAIIDELRASLNTADGGELAANMAELYEYSSRQLLRANLEGRTAPLDEVAKLLREIRGAWIQIAPRP